jgi:NAD(P)-dependent dehydrogenase (short-subunit alcohol dehydrogenase family)
MSMRQVWTKLRNYVSLDFLSPLPSTLFSSLTRTLGSLPGTRVVTSEVDVRSQQQVQNWIDSTVAEFGRLDGAANIAGIAGGAGDTTCATIVRYITTIHQSRANTDQCRTRKSLTGIA